MHLRTDCCEGTETSKLPPYNTHFSSFLTTSISSPHPWAERPSTSRNGQDKTGGRQAEGEQGRGSVPLVTWTATATAQPKTDYQEQALTRGIKQLFIISHPQLTHRLNTQLSSGQVESQALQHFEHCPLALSVTILLEPRTDSPLSLRHYNADEGNSHQMDTFIL